jgi:hypothetical protein
MGIAGSDDFALKVSADGANWVDALRVDAATGRIRTAVSGWREMLEAPRNYYVDQTLGNDGNDGLSPGTGAFATITKAVEVAQTVDTGSHDITVQLAQGTYALAQPIEMQRALVGGGRLVVRGEPATPELVLVDAVDEAFIIAQGHVLLHGLKVQNSSPTASAILAKAGSNLSMDAVVFGSAGGQLEGQAARLSFEGACEIAGDAAFHLRLSDGAQFNGNGQSVTLTTVPEFQDAYCICTHTSVARFAGQSFAGSATGSRYYLSANGVIDSGGVVLPGDGAGSVQTGGLYL